MNRIKGLKGHEINVIIPGIPGDYKENVKTWSKHFTKPRITLAKVLANFILVLGLKSHKN